MQGEGGGAGCAGGCVSRKVCRRSKRCKRYRVMEEEQRVQVSGWVVGCGGGTGGAGRGKRSRGAGG